MMCEEPKVQFVPIDLSIDATGPDSNAGLETCTGPRAPSNLCPYQETPKYWLDEHGNEWRPT